MPNMRVPVGISRVPYEVFLFKYKSYTHAVTNTDIIYASYIWEDYDPYLGHCIFYIP